MSEVLGIDLGTTYTVVGVWVSEAQAQENSSKTIAEKVEIIANKQGSRTTPSCVAFTETERLIGIPAKNQILANPKNTIVDSKRLIGLDFSNESVQDAVKRNSFEVINDNGNPKYVVEYKNKRKILSPVEISAMILRHVKEYVECYRGKSINKAVITVPAYFNNSQREATKLAGSIAGLEVLRIINEPTAAALAHGLNERNNENVVVFDLGGGTFDVSVLTIDNGVFNVISTAGDNHLGGEDFNNRMLDHFIEEFKNSNDGCDLRENARSVERLRTACETTKLQLSDSERANIELYGLFNGQDFSTSITRAKFEELCDDLFSRTLALVKKALKDAGMDKTDVHNILLVGGSTRIPKIQEMLKDFFGKDASKSVNPDEAVAHGAAIQAAILQAKVPGIVLVDVIPLSLGIQLESGEMSVLIKRNSPKPFTANQTYTTVEDNQQKVNIVIYEGERTLATKNTYINEFVLTIPPLPKETPNIDVSFHVNNDGMLEVTAVEKSSGVKRKIAIAIKKRHSDEEVERMIEDVNKFKEEDDRIIEKLRFINVFEKSCYKAVKKENDVAMKKKYNEYLDWLHKHSSVDLEKIKDKYEEFRVLVSDKEREIITVEIK